MQVDTRELSKEKQDIRRQKSAVRFLLEGILVEASVSDTSADCTVVPEFAVRKMEKAGITLQRRKMQKLASLRPLPWLGQKSLAGKL
jgi:hypothetical protein